MIPKLGPMELVVILVVILVIFGPKNLPKLGSALGKSVKNLRDGMNGGSQTSNTVQSQAAPEDASEPAVLEDAQEVPAKPAPKHTEQEPVAVH
jgi:sec-independent protein translocase protein TatA